MIGLRLSSFYEACRRVRATPSRFLFAVSISQQRAYLFEAQASRFLAPRKPLGGSAANQIFSAIAADQALSACAADQTFSLTPPLQRGEPSRLHEFSPFKGFQYRLLKTFICSTSKFGIGEEAGSNKTPRGLHQIAEKIGDGCPVGTIFKSRKIVGYTWQGMADASITTRILWLDGLEPGFNRGGSVDSHDRYIYIHGTGDETTIGRPASHGCVQLAARDLVPLFNTIPTRTLVWIEP